MQKYDRQAVAFFNIGLNQPHYAWCKNPAQGESNYAATSGCLLQTYRCTDFSKLPTSVDSQVKSNIGLNLKDLKVWDNIQIAHYKLKMYTLSIYLSSCIDIDRYMCTHTCTHMDMVTPTGLMRWELLCDSDGATFVKSDSQLRQPGLRDNSLPVRLCVLHSVCMCVCAGTRVCTRVHTLHRVWTYLST